MTDDISIVPCKSRKDWRLFESLPELLHQGLPNFVPPFPGAATAFRKPSHPFHLHGRMLPYIAFRAGVPVGRIAAVVNETHNRYHSDKVGFFGFFDFVNDIAVARALLDKAAADVARNGLVVIRGPVSPTQNDECGLLVDGFDQEPFFLMPYNPEYYVDIYGELGLKPARDLFSYYAQRGDDSAILERTGKIVERVKRKTNIKFRCIDLKNIRSELGIIENLWNKTLNRNWNFMPVARADLDFAASDLKKLIDPELVLIAEHEGTPVGISMTLPNINEFMQLARKSRGLLRLVRLVWYFKTRRPKAVRLAVLGVLPEFRAKGIAPAFFFESIMRGIAKYESVELGWVQDNNDEVNKTARSFGVRLSKTHRIYDKDLFPAGSAGVA